MNDLQVTDYAATHGYLWETVEQALSTLRQEREAGTDYWQKGSMKDLLDCCVRVNEPRPTFAEIQASKVSRC